jgi:hypothetical protein
MTECGRLQRAANHQLVSQSATRNPQSTIPDPQSAIRNPHSAIVVMILALLGALAFPPAARAELSEDTIQETFFPYRNGVPQVSGIKPGMVINKDNWEVAKDVMYPEYLDLVKKGWTQIKVGETLSFALPKEYIDATRKYAEQVKLSPEGYLENYVAGIPFPGLPDPSDPQAGIKLAWNFKRGFNWGDNACICPFYWSYVKGDGTVEKTIKWDFHIMNFKHRVFHEPRPEILPNPQELFRSLQAQAYEPFDLKDTQFLLWQYEDERKRDDSWLYLGFQRRVRRLSQEQRADSFLGSDAFVDDFEGYEGRVTDMKWKFVGEKVLLMPYYKHNEMEFKLPDFPISKNTDEDGYHFIEFSGRANWFPNITWQLRKMYVLEVTPKDPTYPYSKRVWFQDAEQYTNPLSFIYDRKGELWKVFLISKAHPDFHLPVNKGSSVALDNAVHIIDVQRDHATTLRFKGQVVPLKPEIFTLQNMRQGR